MKKVICRDIQNNTTEVGVEELSFRPSVYGVAIQNNKVLLVPQWDGYDFPGGGIDLGENLEEALLREFKEETGLEIQIGEILLAENNFFTHPFSKKHLHTILLYFSCEITGGEISTDGFDEHETEYARKAEWVDIDTIDTIKFHTPIDSPTLIRKAHTLLK